MKDVIVINIEGAWNYNCGLSRESVKNQKRSSDVLLSVSQPALRQKMPWFVAFANVCGVNIPTVVNFNLPTVITEWSCKEMRPPASSSAPLNRGAPCSQPYHEYSKDGENKRNLKRRDRPRNHRKEECEGGNSWQFTLTPPPPKISNIIKTEQCPLDLSSRRSLVALIRLVLMEIDDSGPRG